MALRTILDGFEKARLQDIGSILGRELPSRLRRSQMLEKLYSYIKEEPGRWISHLMESDILLLKDLVHAGPEKVRYLSFADYPSVVEISGIVEFDDSDERFHKVWISREIYEIVAPVIDSVASDVEKSGRYEFERVAMGYMNLYGVLPTSRFVELMTDWYISRFGHDYHLLDHFISSSPVLKLCRYEDLHGDNMVSPCIDDLELVMAIREQYSPGKKRKSFNLSRALDAGSGAPFFTPFMDTPEGKALENAYRLLGYSGFALIKAEHDTWIESQYTDAKEIYLFDPANAAPLANEVSDAVWESCCLAVCDYADSIPKWSLDGFSAKETGQCLIDRDSWRNPEDELPLPSVPTSDTYPSWSMPEPTVSSGYKVLDSDFPVGFSVPHVAPNDPCPCGSGLRYCRCHGKYLS